MEVNKNSIIDNYESVIDMWKENNLNKASTNILDISNQNILFSNDSEYNDDVNIDLESLYYSVASLKNINSKCSQLAGALSSINLDGSDLSSAYILGEVKTEVKGIIDGDLSDLCNNAENVKNKIAENDPAAAAFFESLTLSNKADFGNFDNNENNVELYNNLIEKFGEENIAITEDGSGYYVTETIKGYKEPNYYFFSSDCSGKDINLLTYLPGKGDDTGGALVEQLKTNVPSNFAAVISCHNQDNTDIMTRFDSIAEDINVTIDNVQVVCFSQSGAQGFRSLNNYLERHPKIENSSLVCIDGYMIAPNSLVKECPNLIAKNVPIFMLGNKGRADGQTVQGMTVSLGDLGLNTHYIKDLYNGTTSNGGYAEDGKKLPGSLHSAYNQNAINGGLFYYLMGINDNLDNRYCDYEFYDYNSSDNKFSQLSFNTTLNL